MNRTLTTKGMEDSTARGFTLIETMIAVTILMLAVAGPIYAASRAIVAAQIGRDQLTASYLAQEGIEYVRAMRDDEYLAAYAAGGTTVSTTAWTNFLTNPLSDTATISGCETTTCTLDPSLPMGTGNGAALSPCSGSACAPLYLAGGVYTERSGISGAVQTPFTRTVQAFAVSAHGERIVSTVYWNFHGSPYQIVITDYLTPWQ